MASNKKDQPATSTPPTVPPTPKTAPSLRQETARERAREVMSDKPSRIWGGDSPARAGLPARPNPRSRPL